ncbi:prolipoprotein diacylglyceryl transferase [Roseobacter sp. HKCCA0434]|uniref:prolipoprotein diacylglyceryl transferase n=1 Tax=Roseobacter sp. HKCCA0434 TaxID=3079297 RepID=UPI002905A559|nr:prolipoprotein diacylglyceryl transferase [Roseobacter sp. HKCCA0434]
MPFPEIDPVALQIGPLALRWYALAYIVGIVGGWWLAARIARRDHLFGPQGAPATPKQIEDFITWLILGIIAGGRLGYVLFYRPGYYLQNPLEIVQVWDGGMSFHGGFLGVCIAMVLWTRRHNVPLMSLADLAAVVTPIGLFLGRVANFINGELWGRPTDVPWGVAFPGQRAQDCFGVPADQVCLRHPSQLYEAFLEGVVLFGILLALVWVWKGLRRPGLATGIFFAGYGLSRFIVEFFRQGDAQYIGPDNPFGQVIRFGDSAWAGLSMGQILSLPMIVVGLALILWALRRRPA